MAALRRQSTDQDGTQPIGLGGGNDEPQDQPARPGNRDPFLSGGRGRPPASVPGQRARSPPGPWQRGASVVAGVSRRPRFAALAAVVILASAAVGLPLILSRPAAAGAFVPTGSMNVGRFGATATLLSDGRVLIAGGWEDTQTPLLASAELYDPAIGTFSATGSMTTARTDEAAALRRRVLFAGAPTTPGPSPRPNSTIRRPAILARLDR